MAEKIAQWVGEVSLLSAIAITQPHAAYAAFTHGLSSKWSYLSRILPNLSTDVCHDVIIEPNLQPLTGEALTRATSNTADGGRLDIAVSGFWGCRFERTFLDVRIFNPHAPANKNTTISKCYRKHEAEKKRAYEQRTLEVEQSTSLP